MEKETIKISTEKTIIEKEHSLNDTSSSSDIEENATCDMGQDVMMCEDLKEAYEDFIEWVNKTV